MLNRAQLVRGLVAAVLWIAAGSANADFEATVGVYFDPEGTVCSGTIEAGVPATIYIVAKTPPGQAMHGTTAEFRFTGLPPSWLVYPVANPATLTFGDPFGQGVTIASVRVQCSPEGSANFLMYTVLVLANETLENVRFDLAARNPPSNPIFSCPNVLSCDAPYFTPYCVSTSPCFVNTTAPQPCAATSAVRHATWTSLRRLYR